MQVNIIMQRENENTIASAISNCLERNAKKAYFFIGNFKETGYKIIEEDLIDIKTKLYFVIGIDKKTTTRSMLEGLLTYTDNVYYYSNNNINEFVSNICIFEYTDEAYMYVSTSNMSESGIQTDLSLYTKIVYNLKDKDDKQLYKSQIKELLKVVEIDGFNKLDKDKINKLVEDKEIFSTRQYNHSVMSISELLGKKSKKEEDRQKPPVEESDDILNKNVEIPKVDLSDISIDIDIPEEEKNQSDKKEELDIDYKEENIELPKEQDQVATTKAEENKLEQEKNEEQNIEDEEEILAPEGIDLNQTLDINDILFSKADLKLDITKEKTPKKTRKKEVLPEDQDELLKVKKLNLNNVSNLIFELPNKNSKEPNSIRVPNYIKTMIPEFFGLDDAQNEEINGTIYKAKNIDLEIVDAKNNIKLDDKNAKITYKPRQSYLTFISEKLNNIMYNENDIIRIIKLSENIYHMEIIDKNMQEYKVWSKLCNQTFRASSKKFGMM